jgi:hypothetical protein
MLVLSLDEPVLASPRLHVTRGLAVKSKKRAAKPKIQAQNVILKKWRLATKSVEPNTSSFAEFQ